MKILHILDHSLPLHSGYTFRSQNIFKSQKNMGFDPVVLTSPKHEQSAGPEDSRETRINGVQYYRTGSSPSSRLPFMSELKLMNALYRRILAVAETETPDIIHAHSPVLNGIPALRAGRRLRIPVVYEIRAFWEDAAVDHGTYREHSWKYRLTQWMETRVCTDADHICILCNGLKNDLVSRGIPVEKISPVFNGIHPDELTPGTPDAEFTESWGLAHKKVLGFVGSFYRYEGLDLLIRAFADIADQCPDWQLLLVGGGEMAAELADLVSGLGLEDRVIMPGRIPHERIAGVYAMIDVLAYPRYAMRLTELVTPLKPLEAMAMGKVLVASDVGGHQELIRDGHTGILFEAGSRDALAEKLLMLAEDSGLRDAMGQQGLDWVRTHHAWQQTTAVYKTVYERVLGNLPSA
ncbi:MAG: TIGR04063 family PEP-CTERM/XrtA system glycosyltransferase [Desulfobacter sp.]